MARNQCPVYSRICNWNTDNEIVGNHSIKSTSIDNDGGSSSNEIMVTIIEEETGNAPISDFSASTNNGLAPLIVSFFDQSSNNPISWLWNFGDGITSTLQNPIHTYSDPGIYSVSLKVENNYGLDINNKPDYITVLNSSNEKLVVGDGFRPHLSPDGNKIVFLRLHASSVSGQDQSDIWSINIDGTQLTQLTNTMDNCEYSPQWHPDCNSIAFVRSSSTNYYLEESGKLMQMDKTGTNQLVVLDSIWKIKDFCFYLRNNNLLIITISDISKPNQVFLGVGIWPNILGLSILRDRGRDVRSAYTPGLDAPDILLNEYFGSPYCVVFNPVNLSEYIISNAVFPWPCLSPDGNKIVAGSDGGLDIGLYIMDKDGNNRIQITEKTDHQPTWSQNTIVFVRYNDNGGSLKECSIYKIPAQ